jgi:hypothetical protein
MVPTLKSFDCVGKPVALSGDPGRKVPKLTYSVDPSAPLVRGWLCSTARAAQFEVQRIDQPFARKPA